MGVLQMLKRAASSVSTPASGKVSLYFDSTSGLPSYKDDTGAISPLVGAPTTRQIIAGAGLSGGGNLSADRTLNYIIGIGGIVTGASKTYVIGDQAKRYQRSNSGSAMTDTLPTLSSGDAGWTLKVDNVGTAVAEKITFTSPSGTFPGGGSTYALNYGCRQTFVWTGTGWVFDAGNGNLFRTTALSVTAAGTIPTYADTTGRLMQDSGISASRITNNGIGRVNVLDYGADNTGATSCETAVSNAITALGAAGGIVYFPSGTYLFTSTPYIISANQIIFEGIGPGQTFLTTASTSGNHLRFTGYGCVIRDLSIQGPGTGTTSSKTAGIGLDMQSTEGYISNIDFAYQYDAMSLSGSLTEAIDITCRYFSHTGIIVNHNSDHRITRVLMNNASGTLPTGSGVDVQVCASLLLAQLNVISSNFALNISPTTGVTVPSVKGINRFFDTSAVGLNMTGAGSVLRSEFTNCWFSSMSVAGIRMNPTTAGGVNGITFVNCDIYQNVGGTTVGVDTNTNVGKWKMVGCSIAGWTTGINLVAGTAHFPTILSNTIGSVSAFGVNTTGIVIGAGAYSGFTIQSNDVVDNTTAITVGAFTAADYKKCRIVDNPGINPKGAVTTPAIPATTVVQTNTTGYRVQAIVKWGTTAPTGATLNGVALATTQIGALSTVWTFVLEPGGSWSFTGTAPVGSLWVGL